MLKYYIKYLFRQFTKTLNQFFYWSSANKNLQTYLSDLSNWKNKSSFEILSLNNILINGHYLKNIKHHVCWKLLHTAIKFLHDCHLQWNSYSQSFILSSSTLSIFPALEIMKLVFLGKILRRFDVTLLVFY